VAIILLALSLGSWLLYLLAEKRCISRAHQQVPLRVAVTGTRGKSSTVRLIHRLLLRRDANALAKVSGSKPMLLLGDSEELPVKRRGKATILEQVRLVLKTALRRKSQSLVCEVMSLTPEFQRVEIRQMLDPTLLVITNIREDHVGVMGDDVQQIARVFARSLPCNGKILLDQETLGLLRSVEPQILSRAEERLVVIRPQDHEKTLRALSLPYPEFSENLLLAAGVAKVLGMESPDVCKALQEVRPDIGALRAFRFPNGKLAVAAFSANDPRSTWDVLRKAHDSYGFSPEKACGLLVLRADRGERTLQWARFLQQNGHPFQTLFVTGAHARWLQAKTHLPRVQPMPVRNVLAPGFFQGGARHWFGFGNFVGTGERILSRWEQEGERQ